MGLSKQANTPLSKQSKTKVEHTKGRNGGRLSSLFKICCGGEEEHHYGSFVDVDIAKELGWESAINDVSDQGTRIKQKENQIEILSRGKYKQRERIYAAPVSLSENFELPVYPKSAEQRKLLEKAISDNFIFMDLNEEERGKLIDAMQEEIVTRDAVIIQQGAVGDYLYIIEEGRVIFVLEKDGGETEQVGTAATGDSFGELALLYDSPRAVSCIATSQVILWKVDQSTFRHLMVHSEHKHHQRMHRTLRSISLFQDLDDATVSRFINSMTLVHWKQGDRIVQKGEVGNVFHILEEGKVRVHNIGLGDSQTEDQILGKGSWFGERALLTGEPRAANVTALSVVTTMAMDRQTFEKTMGPLQHLLERQMRKQAMKALPIFSTSDITDPEIDQLVDLMAEVSYQKGDQLATAGQPYQMKLWIIRRGRLLVYSKRHNNKMHSLKSGDYFGDKSIQGDPNHVSSHTATCEGDLICWELTRQNIENVIGDIQRLGRIATYTKSRSGARIRLKDLMKQKLLGQGGFGTVWLVHHHQKMAGGQHVKCEMASYALKTMNKARLVDAKMEQSAIREKEFLCHLDHPFILQLVESYQDEHNLYLLLPVIPGGELYEYLQKNKTRGRGLGNDSAAFYAACTIEALGHLHQRRIAFRDLKLENILIDEDGYGKIVDLGFAKVVDDKTWTLCGTPEYLAPELILSKGHDQAVDYWAFGVVVCELLVGTSPFYMRGSSQTDMFKRIVLMQYDIPEYVDECAASLIQQLLVRKQTERLGNLANGYFDIKNHPWFRRSDICFRKLIQKELQAPWKPEVNKDAWDRPIVAPLRMQPRETGRRLTKQEQEVFKGF